MVKPAYTIAMAAIMVAAVFAGVVVFDDQADATPAEFTQVVYKVDDNNVKAVPVSGDTFVAMSPEELGLTYKGTFQYWSCDDLVFVPGQSYSTTLEGAANNSITLTAKINLPTTVAIINNGDTTTVAVADVISTIVGIDTSDKTMGIFQGWLYSGDNKVYNLNDAKDKLVTGEDDTEIDLDAGETLTAQYRVIYDIEWVVNGVTIAKGTSESADTIGKPIDPSIDNYTFGGWKDAAGVIYSDAYVFSADTTFTAVLNPVQFTVTFMVGELGKEVFVPYMTTVAPIQLPAGYAAWCTMKEVPVLDEDGQPVLDENGNVTTEKVYEPFDFTMPITEDVELYAYGSSETPDENIYVTFNIEGHLYGPYAINDRFSIPNTDREGYAFQGWIVQGGDGTKMTSEVVQSKIQAGEFTEDTVFVATYEAVEPPAPAEPAFWETTSGQAAIVIVVFIILALCYAVYSNMFGLKDKMFGYTISKKEKKE